VPGCTAVKWSLQPHRKKSRVPSQPLPFPMFLPFFSSPCLLYFHNLCGLRSAKSKSRACGCDFEKTLTFVPRSLVLSNHEALSGHLSSSFFQHRSVLQLLSALLADPKIEERVRQWFLTRAPWTCPVPFAGCLFPVPPTSRSVFRHRNQFSV
jgi:hypothetical protein